MPLLGGDSNSFWRFDVRKIIQAFGVILILRAITLVFDLYPRHIPIIDDFIQFSIECLHWASTTFNMFTSKYMAF